MERMAQKGNIEMSQAFYMEVWNGYERSKELEEENKNLRDTNGDLQRWLKQTEDMLKFQQEENKNLREKIKYIRKLNTYDYNELQDLTIKLNIKVASLEGEIKGLNSVIDKLKEENQTLELWLDNKEKVNKRLKEEIDKYEALYGRLYI